MPIYEYRCGNCEHKMEAIQKISDDPLKTCPECNQETLRKLVSAAAFKLKGSGWYETDFKDNKSKAKGENKSPANGKKEDANKNGKEETSKPSADSPTSSSKKDTAAAKSD